MIYLISGSREFPNEELARIMMMQAFEPGDTVIHGGASGVDTWADQEAKSAGCVVDCYKADWNTYGRAAGPIRNEHMANLIRGKQGVIAMVFWDGESRGTKHMLEVLDANKTSYILVKEFKNARTD